MLLGRQLNAANERIKRLEAVTNDPHALWANWLRGSVALPVGIGDVREYQDRIKRLEEWKESALEVEREWDANAIATLLGAKLGESQRKVIQREVPLLLERIKRLEEAGDALEAWLRDERLNAVQYTVSKWRKAKEAKP